MEHEYRTWIEIDTDAIGKNIRAIKTQIGDGVKFCAVVKSNAYGHYLHRFAKSVLEAGVDMLAVDSFIEARALREDGITAPILVLGYTLPRYYEGAAKLDIALTISSLDQLEDVRGRGVHGLRVHIKFDTGMHRQGFQEKELTLALPVVKELIGDGSINIMGAYSHLAAAKSRAHSEFAQMQRTRFEEMIALMQDAGVSVGIRHLAASGGTLMYPEMHYDMVRIGMACYGHYPSNEVREIKSGDVALIPVLSWRSLVSEVKQAEKGEKVGYDGTHLLERDSILAVIPVGYWHGFDRGLGDKAEVLVRGKRARVIGRVSMDMVVVDVTDAGEVHTGDIVTLIGKDKDEEITPEGLAEHIGTTAYEILTRINPLIERIYG